MANTVIENGINFNNIFDRTISKSQSGIVASGNNNNNGKYEYKRYSPVVMGLDIDWNGAILNSYTGNLNINNETVEINKTSDLLKYIQNKVNTSDFVNLLNKYLEVDSSLDKQVIQTSNNEYKIQLSKKS